MQQEHQTCTRTWRTWPKFFEFADLPPRLKGAKIRWRQFTFSLELTLVFEGRDLNSVIQQMVRSRIWRNLRRRKLHLAETASDNRSFGGITEGIQRRTNYGIVLSITISDTKRWTVFFFGLCNTLLLVITLLKHCILNMTYNPNFDISMNRRMSDRTLVAHCSHKEKQSKCYNKLNILELMSKLNKNKI